MDSLLIESDNKPEVKHKRAILGRNNHQSKFLDSHKQDEVIEVLFDILKDTNGRVPVSKLFSTIEETGIQLSDPRLKEMMESIARSQRRSLKHEDTSKDSYYFKLETFKEIIKDNIIMLHRIMSNDFVVPEFNTFVDEIKELYELCKDNKDGEPANYIPQLARVSPEFWGVSVCTIDGQRDNVGDTDVSFCIQSASKPLNYALAISELGAAVVHEYLGYEPSGISFNSIALNDESKPHNPMINSGAIVTCSLMKQKDALSDRFDYVMKEYKRMAGYGYVGFSNSTFLSERCTADRNFCLGYYMQENKCFPTDNQLIETLDFYFQLCSMEITCESGAVIAGTLANGGCCPLTGDKVLSSEAVQHTLSLMHSCGMYDYSGQFAFKVGLPAKSGVSGVVLLVIPNLMGIAMWSPPLDKLGNSCRGIEFCQRLVDHFSFHNYDSLLHSANKRDPRKSSTENKSQEIVSLLFSAYNNDVTALRRVWMSGIDMSQADYDGRTALHVAAAEGHADVVSYLLGVCDVNPNVEDRWGFTPYKEAVRFNHKEVAETLMRAVQKDDNDTSDDGSEFGDTDDDQQQTEKKAGFFIDREN